MILKDLDFHNKYEQNKFYLNVLDVKFVSL